MKVRKNGYYVEKEYNIAILEECTQLARDTYELHKKQIPINGVYKTVGSLRATLRVDLRKMNQIHDKGVELIYG